MDGASNQDSVPPILGLYETFRQLLKSGDSDRLISEVLLHEASLAQLDLAVCNVLKGQARQEDLRHEVRQAAIVAVIERFRKGEIPYADRGPRKFAAWVWTVWRKACLDAWKRELNLSARNQARFDLETCVEAPSSDDVLWDDVFSAIARLQDLTLQTIMFHWAAGLNGTESAQQMGLSISAISKRRQQGRRLLRRMFKVDPPHDAIG